MNAFGHCPACRFLDIAGTNNISAGFVFFGDRWSTMGANLSDPCKPTKGRYNGCWKTSPQAEDRVMIENFRPYVVDVAKKFKDDKRVLWWEGKSLAIASALCVRVMHRAGLCTNFKESVEIRLYVLGHRKISENPRLKRRYLQLRKWDVNLQNRSRKYNHTCICSVGGFRWTLVLVHESSSFHCQCVMFSGISGVCPPAGYVHVVGLTFLDIYSVLWHTTKKELSKRI